MDLEFAYLGGQIERLVWINDITGYRVASYPAFAQSSAVCLIDRCLDHMRKTLKQASSQ